MYMRLTEELKKSEKRVEELKILAKKDMVFKFGREVDLDKVCAAIINLELLDKEIQLEKLRKLHYIQRQRIIDNILDAKDDLTGEIRENSNLKILEAMIMERKRDFDYFVWKHQRDTEKREVREASRKQIRDPSREASNKSISVPLAIARGASSFELDEATSSQRHAHRDEEVATAIDGEVRALQEKVRQYEMKANALRQTLKICKRKTGLPPILPLARKQGPCDASGRRGRTKFPPIQQQDGRGPGGSCVSLAVDGSPKRYRRTAKELEEMNQNCPRIDPRMLTCGAVKTLYETSNKDDFDEEMTIAPTMAPSSATGLMSMSRQEPPTSPEGEEEEDYGRFDIQRRSRKSRGSEYPGEFQGEGDPPAVRMFEDAFGQYLKTERSEVMEYLGEVDEDIMAGYIGEEGFSDFEEEDGKISFKN